MSTTDLIVRTEPLGGSPLTRAALEGRTPPEWYRERPDGETEWLQAIEATRAAAAPAWLDSLAPALDARAAAAARLARVADGRGVVVTTGQQPGLFGGPVYTWAKALAVLALADELERASGVPVAPVFWAATDDADFVEASWTVIARVGGAERLVAPATGTPGAPMAETPLGDVSGLLDAMEQHVGAALDFDVVGALRAAYGPDATVGGAFVALLRSVLEPHGVAVLDAAHPSVSQAAHPTLARALRESDRIARAARERSAAIGAAGYAPQVRDVDELSLVFERGPASKRRLPIRDAARVADAASPGSLSPNVLLRPIVERTILPTVAYLAGPAELAYFAQTSAVAAALGVEPPLVVPRWSGTIIEPHVSRILDRYRLIMSDLADPHAAETRLAREAMPAATAGALRELRQSVSERLASLRDAARVDGALVDGRVVEGVERSFRSRLERFDRRLTAAVKRRELEMMTQIATARGALFPLGMRQERALNLLPLLGRHGSVVLDKILERAREHARALVSPAAAPALQVTR